MLLDWKSDEQGSSANHRDIARFFSAAAAMRAQHYVSILK